MYGIIAKKKLIFNVDFLIMARSSSGQGRRPLKAEITGSTPVRATCFLPELKT